MKDSVSHRRRRRMYCGSCLQDNALAAELLRRRHDIVLLPLYTPTLDRRAERQSVARVLRRHQRVPAAASRRLPSRAAVRRSPARFVLAPEARVQSGRSAIDAKRLGELTVSVLRGEQGHQRKEIEKLVEWLRTEPPFDVIHLPNSLLISLAEPLKRALGRPVVCTLQGEDLFLRGLPEPYASRRSI